jgi:hypothetical protein
MRWAIAFVLMSLPCVARADAYAWGGAIDGLEVSVVLAGFREGAGGDGWSEEGARRFARRGAEIVALMGGGLRLEEQVGDDDGLVAVFGARRVPLGVREFEGSDAEWDRVVRALVAQGLARSSSTTPRVVTLYTIELPGTTRADLEEPAGQAFYEACVPCAPHAVHTLGGRRVIGVFSGRGAARRALRSLETQGVRGRVARL